MKILLDSNVRRLLRRNLPNHQVDTAFERNWHTLTNGELLEQAESDQYQLLITSAGSGSVHDQMETSSVHWRLTCAQPKLGLHGRPDGG